MIAEHLVEEYHLIRGSYGTIALPDVCLIRLTGEDALEWLQGQATNDLRNLPDHTRRQFCFCDPTGRMIARLDAWNVEEVIYLAFDSACREAVERRIEQMVIMEDLSYEVMSDSMRLITVQGPKSDLKLDLPASSLRFESSRTGLGGFDWWVAEGVLDLPNQISSTVYDLARLEAGNPAFGFDWTDKTLPPELGPFFERTHISYTKGCYTGQEVLMRIHSRGHTNRTWVGLVSEHSMEPGQTVLTDDGKEVGLVTSARVSPVLGPIAGAMVRNVAINPGANLKLEGGGEVVIHEMPLVPPI